MYNSNINLHLRGAYFIYLNRVGFNGVYRISRTGNYNVPYGCGRGKITKEYKDLLKADSKALKGVSITQGSFDYLLDSEFHFKPQSLIFLDPPYTVSHNNNGFIAYNRNLFDIESQRRLRRLLDKIDSEGAYFIMTNAKHSIIREIFDGYFFHEEFRSSVIGGKGARRGLISEYIVTNFEKE